MKLYHVYRTDNSWDGGGRVLLKTFQHRANAEAFKRSETNPLDRISYLTLVEIETDD